MLCPKCGKQVKKNIKFCPNCGMPIYHSDYINTNNTPVLILKPQFIPLLSILSVIPAAIFLSIWGGIFFGGFAGFFIQMLQLKIQPLPIFIFFGSIFLVGPPFFIYIFKLKTYAKTEYRFYKTKLDYYEGFFTIEEKTINYRDITEINLRQGIFQRRYGLGTIILSTPATGTIKGTAKSGIRIHDIKNPKDVYKQVKNLISKVR